MISAVGIPPSAQNRPLATDAGRFFLAIPLRLARLASSPEGRALGIKMKFANIAKASHFGGGGIALAMTERVRRLKIESET